MGPLEERYRFGPAEFVPAQRTLRIGGQAVNLGGRAFDLLSLLVRHADRVVTKEEIFEAVWPGLAVQPNNLQVHVWTLRRLLGASAIATVSRRGYRLMLPVQPVQPAQTVQLGSPAPLQRLRGSEGSESAEQRLLEQLQLSRVLTLTGATASRRRAAAHAAAQAFAGAPGPWLLEPAQVAPGSGVLARVLRELAGGGLVVLHDAHRATALADQAAQLLARHAAARLLLTAPAALELPGEQVWPLQGGATRREAPATLRWLSRARA